MRSQQVRELVSSRNGLHTDISPQALVTKGATVPKKVASLLAIGVTLVALGASQHPSESERVPDAVLQIIATQVDMEHNLWSLPLDTSNLGRQISVERVHLSEGLDFTLWRGRLWTSTHWRPYLVATDNTHTWRLGGFPGPELADLARNRRLMATTPDSAVELARILAALLDPNGAARLIYLGHANSTPGEAPIVEAWRRKAPKGWPVSATTRFGNGSLRVQMSVLSLVEHDQGTPWQGIAYSFDFLPSGYFGGWAVRQSEHFVPQ